MIDGRTEMVLGVDVDVGGDGDGEPPGATRRLDANPSARTDSKRGSLCYLLLENITHQIFGQVHSV